jgi:hypothetical protein
MFIQRRQELIINSAWKVTKADNTMKLLEHLFEISQDANS